MRSARPSSPRARWGLVALLLPALAAAEEGAGEPELEPEPSPVAAAPAPRTAPALEVLPGGMARGIGKVDGRPVWIGTPDRRFIFRFSGFVHIDYRLVAPIGTGAPPAQGINLPRRARFAGEGTLFGNLDYRVMFDPAVEFLPLDAYLDWRALPELNLRVGRFKSPVGFERRARAFSLVFNERGYPNALAPNRDFGVFLHGQTREGFFSYEVAMLSGAANLESTVHVMRGTPEAAARVYVQPFRLIEGVPVLRELGVGFSGSVGDERGDAANPYLGRVATSVRTTFFRYRPELTFANGERARFSGHAHWRYRRFNALLEYAWAGQRVQAGDAQDFVAHQAWQGYLGACLTDDDWGFFGINPKQPFNPLKNEWGALAIAVRYTGIQLGPRAFPIFANPDEAARQAHSAAASFQWVLSQNMGFQFDVETVFFRGGAPGGGDRPAELSATLRLQAFY